MADLTVSTARYDASKGVVADIEGGDITVELEGNAVLISGNPAGLRDLARWCLALSDAGAPDGSHVHLDANVIPMTADSLPLILGRA